MVGISKFNFDANQLAAFFKSQLLVFIPPANKTSWQRGNNVSLYVPATSQVHLK